MSGARTATGLATGIATGITTGIIVRAGLRGLAAGAAVALVVYGFSAYLDPAVYLSALSVFALCS